MNQYDQRIKKHLQLRKKKYHPWHNQSHVKTSDKQIILPLTNINFLLFFTANIRFFPILLQFHKTDI